MADINLPANCLFVIEINADGSATVKGRSMKLVGDLVVAGQVKQPKPAGMTSEERSMIKDAILASVRSGAHGNMDPTSLAESLKVAFSFIDSADPSAVGRTA